MIIYLCFQKSKSISYDESNRLEIHLGMVGQDAPERRKEASSEQRRKAGAIHQAAEELPEQPLRLPLQPFDGRDGIP